MNPVFIRRFFSEHGGMEGKHGDVNPSITGITVACLQASAAVGSLIAGRLGDIIGRKKCVRIGAFIYFICAFIQGFAPNLACFIAGRTIQGLAVGFLSMTVPVIQTEIAAPHRRGLMVGVEYTFLIGGYALSCWVDYGFFFALPSNVSWQGPYFVQMGLAFILFSMSFFLPETPRWLARNGFAEEALQTLADLHSNGDINDRHVQSVFLEVQEAVRYEASLGQSTWLVSWQYEAKIRYNTNKSPGNVHQIPQADLRRLHRPDVRPAQRHQRRLLLPAQHARRGRLLRQEIPPLHRRELRPLRRRNNQRLVPRRPLGPPAPPHSRR